MICTLNPSTQVEACGPGVHLLPHSPDYRLGLVIHSIPKRGKPVKVLIIDDDPWCQALKTILRQTQTWKWWE